MVIDLRTENPRAYTLKGYYEVMTGQKENGCVDLKKGKERGHHRR
jgi:hypothetical protein